MQSENGHQDQSSPTEQEHEKNDGFYFTAFQTLNFDSRFEIGIYAMACGPLFAIALSLIHREQHIPDVSRLIMAGIVWLVAPHLKTVTIRL